MGVYPVVATLRLGPGAYQQPDITELAPEHAMYASATFDRSTRRLAGTRHGLTDRSISPDTIIDTHITTARARLYHHDRATEGETIDRPTLP